MTNGPLPPHERPWRHPSELAAAPLEPPTRSGRLLIVSTATVSLVLVGALMFVMTPGRSDAPVARLESTLVAVGAVEAVTAGGPAIATTIAGAATGITSTLAARVGTAAPVTSIAATAVAPTTSAPPVSVSTSAFGTTVTATAEATGTNSPETASTSPTTAVDRSAPAETVLVTPIGEGLAVTTHAAMGLSAGAVSDDAVTPMAAALPSGSPVEVDIVATDGDIVVVSILSGATTEDRTLADDTDSLDRDSTYVVVDGTTARFDAAIYPPPHLPEAAPIVDDEGRLLALCTLGPAGIELVTVSALPTAPPATTAAAPAPSSEPEAAPSLPESTPPTTTATTAATTTAATTTTTTTSTTVAEVAPATSIP